MNILHLTDFHIDQFNGEREFLREGFYREYIDRLFLSLVKKTDRLTIDYLMITGDLVNIGKIENFSHAEVVIDYILSKFSIERNNVCISIGNHDYKWKEMSGQDLKLESTLKNPFKKFKDKYNNVHILETDNYFLTQLSDNTVFLSIDSTWNSINGSPGEFSGAEEDQLITFLAGQIDSNSTLLIGCHFPIISFDNNFLAGEEVDWHSNHVWIKGNTLRDRIRRLGYKNTIWFHGDIHASDQKVIENETFIATSKFGGPPDTSQQRRQALFITVNESSISKIACSYEFPTHEQNPRLGDWSCSDLQELRVFVPVEQSKVNLPNTITAYNKEVETEILRLIKERELYKFGRFHVNDEYVSLGWVDINRLMSDKELLNRITDKCFELVKTKLGAPCISTLFLGVEIIGGIIASQLSVRLNAKNSIIPIRSKFNHYSEFEFSHSSAFDDIIHITDIVIFIDIISTGNTITTLIEEILSKNGNINIHVITIITNNIENKINSIPKTKSYNSFCTKLKIPIIKNTEMPEEDYVKPDLKF